MTDDSDRWELLNQVATRFSEAVPDERELLSVVAREIAAVTGDGCVVRLLSVDREWLEATAVHHTDARLRAAMLDVMERTRERAGTGVWKRVLDGRVLARIAASPDNLPPDASPQQIDFVRRFPFRYFMAAPLVARGRVIGGISLVRFRDNGDFSEADEGLLRTLADRAALAIDNSRLLTAERTAREQAERAEAVARRQLAELERTQKTLQETEERFRHAQKMEAVGRLAGGIAHDFNNVLTVILSYAHMVRGKFHESEPILDDLAEIEKAGTRAATLTRQLLAFSRQQVVQPKTLIINEVIQGVEKMLRRVVGEGIELTLLLDPDVDSCTIDPGYFEQVLMNLVVNARDATSGSGKVIIETRNAVLDEEYVRLHPGSSVGPHVVVTVSDTGVGMDRATQARIFEPFFTTKSKDKGTGLGLSTVYGIVQQSGGSIWVYSEPGAGTTFKIYLPRATEGPFTPVTEPTAPVTTTGDEAILLVEDDEQVRRVVSEALAQAGYRVINTSDPGEALLASEQHGARIDLLLTDLVMPRMGGRQLAERLVTARPEMKVLYMSGYTDDAAILQGILHAGINYLAKPVTPDSLLRKVRQVLDA